MTKQLNEAQFVEIMANIKVVTEPLPTVVSDQIKDALDAFIDGQTKGEAELLTNKIFARVRELGEVHLKTAQRQFRGARNG
jgi:hypothetical protein